LKFASNISNLIWSLFEERIAMRSKALIFVLFVAVFGLGPLVAFAQDDEVRGAFLTTRPKATDKKKPAANTKPNRRRPKPASTSSAGTNSGAPVTPNPTTRVPPKVEAARMGLGLTLFMRDSNGLSLRVDPTREFRKGDHVRVLLETNVDGYLYIFNTTDGGAPVMIYPDPELDEGGNYLQSHVPVEIPSSLAAEERLKWFTFDAQSGVEKLHFVLTREPLTAVPIEDDLISLCRSAQSKCPWNPDAEVWAMIQKELSESVQVGKPTGVGKAQTSAEQLAVTRGIGLNRDDAEPSLIMLTASTSKAMLVVTLELIHKVAGITPNDEGDPGVVLLEELPQP
jgi:hypothetical protein